MSLEIEKQLLGLILSEDRYLTIAEDLRPVHFQDPFHRAIYESIQRVYREKTSLTDVMIAKYVKASGPDPLTYIRTLKVEVEEGADERDFAEDLIAKWSQATLQSFKEDIDKISNDDSLTGEEVLGKAVSILQEKFDDQPVGGLHTAKSLTDIVIEPTTPNAMGFKTSMSAFDDLTGVLFPGDLVVVGGATSMGKSSFCQGASWNTASSGIATYFHTNEMTAPQAMQRVFSQVSGVPLQNVRHVLKRNLEQSEKLKAAKAKIDSWPIHLDSGEKTTVENIRMRTQRAVKAHNVKFVFIDHLHDIKSTNYRDPERVRLGEIVSDLKAMAIALNVVVVLAAHMNRESMKENRNYKKIARPTMDQLAGSSAIEKKADIVLLVHRPIYYIERMRPTGLPPDDYFTEVNKWTGKAEIIKVKHRQGRGYGVATVNFEETTTLFYKQQEELGHEL